MKKFIFLSLMLSLFIAFNVSAVERFRPPLFERIDEPEPPTGSDSPLTSLLEVDGNVDFAVSAVAHPGSGNSGTFTISGIPTGATILKAYFIVTSFSGGSENISGSFNSNALASQAPTKADSGGGLICKEYRWDVTSFVTGNGTFPYTFSTSSNLYGDILLVAYEHSSLSEQRLAIFDGSESLMNAASATKLGGFKQGSGKLVVFTQADDTQSGTGESLAINGQTLASGEVYRASLGNYASLLAFDVNTVDGDNTVTVTTAGDWFGLHVVILRGKGNQAPVADITGPTEANVGDSVTFDGSGSSDPDGDTLVSYTWDFGDGITEETTTPTVTHVYDVSGTFNVTLVVNDGKRDSLPATTAIIIQTPPCSSSPASLAGSKTGSTAFFLCLFTLPVAFVFVRKQR